jgi:predicted DNA binding CopG/RHH family protein
MTTNKIEGTADAWENRDLGASAVHVGVASAEHEFALDRALDLQSISIRLPKQLIDQYKLIAHFHGVGYQPLMRDILARFVPGALQEIMQAQMQQAKAAAAVPLVASVKPASARHAASKSAARKAQRKAA